MMDRLKHYGYEFHDRTFLGYLFMPLLIVLPLEFDKQIWLTFNWKELLSDKKTKAIKSLLSNIIFYFKRCHYFYRIYINIIFGEKYSGVIINNLK